MNYSYFPRGIRLSDPILYDYLIHTIDKFGDQLHFEQKNHLINILIQFAKEKLSYFEAKDKCNKLNISTIPLQNIKNILDTPPFISSSNNNHDVSQKKVTHWTKNEDNRLVAAIFRFGLEDWSNIVNFVGNNRTRPQCLQRWTRTLNPKLNKEGWSNEEEQLLISIVHSVGENCWTKVSHLIGSRSDVQCKYHYEQMKKRYVINNKISTNKISEKPNKKMEIQMISSRIEIDDFLKLFSVKN